MLDVSTKFCQLYLSKAGGLNYRIGVLDLKPFQRASSSVPSFYRNKNRGDAIVDSCPAGQEKDTRCPITDASSGLKSPVFLLSRWPELVSKLTFSDLPFWSLTPRSLLIQSWECRGSPAAAGRSSLLEETDDLLSGQ